MERNGSMNDCVKSMDNIMNIQGVECFEKDDVIYLKLETVARGAGVHDHCRKR